MRASATLAHPLARLQRQEVPACSRAHISHTWTAESRIHLGIELLTLIGSLSVFASHVRQVSRLRIAFEDREIADRSDAFQIAKMSDYRNPLAAQFLQQISKDILLSRPVEQRTATALHHIGSIQRGIDGCQPQSRFIRIPRFNPAGKFTSLYAGQFPGMGDSPFLARPHGNAGSLGANQKLAQPSQARRCNGTMGNGGDQIVIDIPHSMSCLENNVLQAKAPEISTSGLKVIKLKCRCGVFRP